MQPRFGKKIISFIKRIPERILTPIRKTVQTVRLSRKKPEAAFALLTGVVFTAAITFFFIANLLVPDTKFSEEENRMLQTFPEFSVSEYLSGRYEAQIEDYSNDQFLGRKAFIRVKAAADLTEGKVEANGVWKGKDGYLLEDITTPEKGFTERTAEALGSFKKAHPKLRMSFLLVPNAANILEDKLPAAVETADQDALMDDFFASLDATGIRTLDVRETFRKYKDEMQLYYHTDHHWTTDGAYLAYRAVASELGIGQPKDFRSVVVKNDFTGTLASKTGFTVMRKDAIKVMLPESDDAPRSVINYPEKKEKTTSFYRLDNLDKKDAYTVFGGSNEPVYTIRTPIKNSRRLLLVKDSYANCMIPMLTQHFNEIVVVDPRYYFDNVDDLMYSEGITDVFFLYNANTFFGNDSLAMMLEG